MSKQRRTFSAEFKREAAALVLDQGYSHIDACRSLGVVDSALRRWVKQLEAERQGVFGFVEQVEDAQRSDRRLQPAAGGVEQVFAGCAAVQVEGGATGVLVALRGASQGDEGGRGLCGSGCVMEAYGSRARSDAQS